MRRVNLLPLVLLAFMAPSQPVAAADSLVDGVPLPSDARVASAPEAAPALQRQWAGVWIGVWDGTLKHILLVESIAEDGTARVVYAVGDSPAWCIRRAWIRQKATVSERSLTIAETGFSATYERMGPDTLKATYVSGNFRTRATMTRADFSALTAPGAVVDWTGRKSDSTAAADYLVDGVPLPSDARVGSAAEGEPALQRQWAGAWVGAWGGGLKHILLVESVAEDGTARVVYAIGDNLFLGARGAWSRHEATVSERSLTIADAPFSATYEWTGQDTLKATYVRGDSRSRATMARADFAALTAPGAVVDWTAGKSELLRTDLVEEGKPIRLEVVIFKPPGAGPFPLAVINHGSTGNGACPALFTETQVDIGLADFLNERGWIVAFPQRRGRGKSDGLYDEGFSANRAEGYTCDADRSLAGAERALRDIEAAVAVLRRRSDVAPSRVLIGGISRGGVLSVAYAGAHPEQILGVINFVGGWVGEHCATANLINPTLFERGARFDGPTLWLYGRDDPVYSIAHSRGNFAAFQKAGGQGTFLEFDVPGGNGHFLSPHKKLWSAPVGDYLNSLTTTEKK